MMGFKEPTAEAASFSASNFSKSWNEKQWNEKYSLRSGHVVGAKWDQTHAAFLQQRRPNLRNMWICIFEQTCNCTSMSHLVQHPYSCTKSRTACPNKRAAVAWDQQMAMKHNVDGSRTNFAWLQIRWKVLQAVGFVVTVYSLESSNLFAHIFSSLARCCLEGREVHNETITSQQQFKSWWT